MTEKFTLYIVESSFGDGEWFTTPCDPRGPLAQKQHLAADISGGMLGFLELKDAQTLFDQEKKKVASADHRIVRVDVTIKRKTVQES